MGIKKGPVFGGFYLRVAPNLMISVCCVLRGPRLKWTPGLVPAGGVPAGGVPAGGGGFSVSKCLSTYLDLHLRD